MKRTLLVAAICLCFALISVYLQLPDDRVHLVFCDVGQGDAILITDGYAQLLVDGGRSSAVLDCLADHVPVWDRTIELVVATHPDADHVSGLVSVMQNYQVLSLLTTSLGKETADFGSFKAALEEEAREQAKIIRPLIGQRIILSPRVQATVLTPGEEMVENGRLVLKSPETRLSDKNATIAKNVEEINEYNNWSIALFLTLDEVKVLLTGDLESEGEKALLEAGLTQDVDILKVGHHGSKSSTSPEFLAEVRPEMSVISVGANNRYHHPSPEVVSRLEHQGSRVLRTDVLGAIEFLIEGASYSAMYARNIP